jgi:hypothetical protein
MQLLKLVVFDVSIETCTAHSIRIVLMGDWAILAQTRMSGRNHTFLHDAPMMRGGAVIMCMISGKAPMTNLPQGAVIFVVVRRVLITLEAVWEGGERPGLLLLLTREEANVSL